MTQKMVKKQLAIFLLLIFSISLVSAITIYSGESYELELEKSYEYYSIVGNSTEIDIGVTQEGNIVTITPNKYSQNDSYEIIFFDSEKETITVYQSSGGGGRGSKTKYVNRTIFEFVDRNVEVVKEVPGDEVEVEKIIKQTPWWSYCILAVFVILIIYIIVRGYKNNEQEINNFSS